MEVKVSENGTFIADELEVERATLIHQGNGIVHLKPNKWMDARILGNGNIFLHSKPERLIINKQGLGTIKDILPDSAPLYDLNNSKYERDYIVITSPSMAGRTPSLREETSSAI